MMSRINELNKFLKKETEIIYKNSIQADSIDEENEENKKVLEDLKRQVEEIKNRNKKVNELYLSNNKRIEEYPVGGPLSSGMYNLLSAKNKLKGGNILKNEAISDKKDEQALIDIKISVFNDVNDEVKKAVKIGIKEAEAERINKRKSKKQKIRKIKIEVNETEHNKMLKVIDKYLEYNTLTDKNDVKISEDANKVNSIDKKA
jgi:hypothetical protein